MHKLLYSIEDYLEDLSLNCSVPWWLRRPVRTLSRTFGEVGDLLAFH